MYNAPPPQQRSWIKRLLLFLALMALIFILLVLGIIWLLSDFGTDPMQVLSPDRISILARLV
jgi:hypothetical protein